MELVVIGICAYEMLLKWTQTEHLNKNNLHLYAHCQLQKNLYLLILHFTSVYSCLGLREGITIMYICWGDY